MNIDNALTNMAIEMDEAGFTGEDITNAGHVVGVMAAMLIEDFEAFNHFMSKVAIRYDMKFKPQVKKTKTIRSNTSIWSLNQ